MYWLITSCPALDSENKMLLISIYLITGPPLSPGQTNSYVTQFPFVKTEIVLIVIIQDVHGIQVIFGT